MREVSVGENLDQYKLIEVIARSGMASIFKAIDQIDGKTVAIKVPYMQFESDVVFYGRFQREEEVGRRLNGRADDDRRHRRRGQETHRKRQRLHPLR